MKLVIFVNIKNLKHDNTGNPNEMSVRYVRIDDINHIFVHFGDKTDE